MVQTKFIDASRDLDCCRYPNLMQRVADIYRDGIVTDAELADLSRMRGETLINYQVAADLLHSMDPSAKDYGKLSELVDYLRRCWILMDFSTDRGALVNSGKEAQESDKAFIENRLAKKKVTLSADQEGLALVGALLTPQQRRKSNEKNIADAVAQMDPAVRDAAALRITRTLKNMKQQELTAARMQLMALERVRGE